MKSSRKASRSSRKASRRNRKASLKANRRASRKSRRASRRQSGGWVVMNPANVDDSSMNAAGRQNLAQGGEYKAMHAGQYGGGAVLEGAPVGTTGMLDSSLRAAAHMGPLDKSMAAIQGMSDQAGGARKGSNRKASRNGRKASRKGRKGSKRKASRKGRKASRKGRKASRKGRKASRKMRGGAALNPADADAPGTLLPSELASKALTQMNPEWKLAENPASFAPAPAPAPKA